jgi:hypothetical protein
LVASLAVGVGHGDDEHAVATVGSSDVGSSQGPPGPHVPERGQVGEDLAEDASAGRVVPGNKPSCEQAGDVFDAHDRGPHLTDDTRNVVPEVSRITGGLALAGLGKGLAGEARRDEIHDSTPRSAVEGAQIVPDRSRGQVAVLHARSQDARDIGVALDEAYRSIGGSEGKLDPELKPSDPGTKSQATDHAAAAR